MSRQPPNLMDFVVIALSPALIMALVGSLTFFLVDVFYVGQYESRLTYTLFFFVIGAVLTARISIEVGSGRASVYGLALGAATWFALLTFMRVNPGGPLASASPLINLLIMGVIWWSAHKLTWDCTFIDERRESSSRGLLSAAGLEQGTDAKSVKRKASGKDADVIDDVAVVGDNTRSLSQRIRKYRESKRKKPHTPGTWIIYFSIAALPIFGLGQSIIPAEEGDRRSYAFRLMLVYVGSGMGLLLTTSFLGLRRYLRQRNSPMPAKMTGTWLALGGGMLAVFLVVATVLPRPYSETSIFGDSAAVDSEKRDASENAQLGDSPGEGEGKPGDRSEAGDGKATADKGKPGGQGKGQSKKGGGDERSNENGSGKGEQDGDGSDDGQRKGEGQDNEEESGEGAEPGEEREGGTDDGSSQSGGSTRLSGALEWVTKALKWLVFAALALVVVLVLFRNGLSWLANFMPWARRWLDAWNNFWANLFGRKAEEETPGEETEELARPAVPFAAFTNPFHDGSAGSRSPEELLQYTFAALEAWSREQGHPRGEGETALEFTRRVGDEFPAIEEPTRRFGGVYARVAYAGRKAPAKTEDIVSEFWDSLS